MLWDLPRVFERPQVCLCYAMAAHLPARVMSVMRCWVGSSAMQLELREADGDGPVACAACLLLSSWRGRMLVEAFVVWVLAGSMQAGCCLVLLRMTARMLLLPAKQDTPRDETARGHGRAVHEGS